MTGRTAFAFLAGVTSLAALAACGHTTPPPAGPAPPASQAAVPATTAPAPKQSVSVPSLGAPAIDAAIHDAWKKAGVTPAARADDATFLRRAYVDIGGTIPTPDATRAFLADTSPDKRAKLVDALLASPDYPEHWMNYWDDVLMGREQKGAVVDRVAFRYWLHARFDANAPWDRIVHDLVDATGQNSVGGARVNLPKAMAMDVPMGTGVPRKGDADAVDLEKINGAVNWTLRFEQSPLDLAGNASRVFLGVQIQCAQCHDHKTEKWKQEDFRRFAAAFFHQRIQPLDAGKAGGMVKRVEVSDIGRVAPRFAKGDLAPVAASKATALDGTDLEKGDATRKALADWMTARDNPWFAKAFVNRMWGHFLGRGFYDPVDDMRASNEPVMLELLDAMARDFAAHDFDVKYLIREITATEAYQLAAVTQAKPALEEAHAQGPDPENKLWGHFHMTPLGPEELLNAIFRATDIESAAERAGIKNMEALRTQVVRQYAFLFDVDEADDEPDFSGTVSQALSLLNGALVGQGSRVIPGSALAGIVAGGTPGPGGDGDRIEAMYLRALGRPPTAEEKTRFVNYVQNAGKAPATMPRPRRAAGSGGTSGGQLDRLGKGGASDPRREAFEDVYWALLNSSEFTFNH